jgi:hypothetical protein
VPRPETRPPDGPGPGTPTSTSRRVRRNRTLWALGLLVFLGLVGWWIAPGGSHGSAGPVSRHPSVPHGRVVPVVKNSRLDPDWERNGKPETFAFGGDVNFPTRVDHW